MKVFKWSADCKLIKGFARSAIYDLTRREVFFVDNDVSDLISKIEGSSEDELLLSETEKEWFEIFKEKEFLVEVPKQTFSSFIDISENWYNPSLVTNAVVGSRNDFTQVNKELYRFNCKHVLIYFEDDENLDRILSLHFKRTDYFSVDLLLKKTSKTFGDLAFLKKKYNCLNVIYVEDKSFIQVEVDSQEIRKLQYPAVTEQHIPTLHFANETFYESHSHNVYFNRKVFINDGGLVSLYGRGSFQTSLGNIQALISSESETDVWFSTKDKTAVCSDCELRRMCIDQRVPKKSEDKWYYLTECSYNPYIGKWSNDEGYIGLTEVGVKTDKGKVLIDQEKLENSFAKIWNE